MKIAAYMLSFYFLLISAQPVLAGLSKMSGSCKMECRPSAVAQVDNIKNTAHHKPAADTKGNEKCPICNCNIYQCAFCTGTIVEENSFDISLFSKSAGNFQRADLILHSSYASDCWQPPELS